MKPTIRELENGGVCVDFGHKWFVVSPDGKVVTKKGRHGKVLSRPATPHERMVALGHAAFDPATV